MERIHSILAVVGCVVLCELAGALGVWTAGTGDSPWYQSLNKPAFNAPAWVFAPVWTLLYGLMGIALYLLMRHWPAGRLALAAFAIQLILNAAWTPVFFGAHRIGLAMVVLVLMWLATGATIVLAWPITTPAAVLLLPYLAWISFAGLLNGAFWLRN